MLKVNKIVSGKQILWRVRMGVPSQCTIVRAIGRSAGALEVLSRRNRTQNHTTNS